MRRLFKGFFEIRPEYVSKIQKRMKNIPIKIDDLENKLIYSKKRNRK